MAKMNYGVFTNFKNKLLDTKIDKLRFITISSLVIKSLIFVALVQSKAADSFSYSNLQLRFLVVYLAFVLFVYSFGYLFSKNKQILFYMGFNTIYSILMISDLWYFRANNYILGVKNILYPGTFNPLNKGFYNFRAIDIIFFIDILILISWIIIRKIECTENRDTGKFSVVVRHSLLLIIICYVAFDICSLGGWDGKLIEVGWDVKMSVKASGPLGYHIIEGVRTSSRKIMNSISKEKKVDIDDWIKYNREEIAPNEYKETAKGKNVVFLQIESLENFIINKSVNGKEITPFLNKISKQGLYFNNFYEQNNAGNSIDCDFIINTSVFPLGDRITGLNYGENIYKNSLPRILKGAGYKTISTHAEDAGEFNWTELHKNGFGVDETWNIDDYDYEETVGYGLSDKSFLKQVSEKLSKESEPFFLQMATISSHGPFDIDSKYRELNLPEEVDKSYLGGYFESAHYADRQIEMFFNKLEQYGLLDNTMIVIYGDHTGVHKYYNDEIQNVSYDGDWWKVVDHKIPLLIYSKGTIPKIVEAHGGQIDVLQTIAYLLGIDEDIYEKQSMGRNLLNTNRDATVIKGNIIVGNVKDDGEKNHLLNAYRIGENIINSDYFSK